MRRLILLDALAVVPSRFGNHRRRRGVEPDRLNIIPPRHPDRVHPARGGNIQPIADGVGRRAVNARNVAQFLYAVSPAFQKSFDRRPAAGRLRRFIVAFHVVIKNRALRQTEIIGVGDGNIGFAASLLFGDCGIGTVFGGVRADRTRRLIADDGRNQAPAHGRNLINPRGGQLRLRASAIATGNVNVRVVEGRVVPPSLHLSDSRRRAFIEAAIQTRPHRAARRRGGVRLSKNGVFGLQLGVRFFARGEFLDLRRRDFLVRDFRRSVFVARHIFINFCGLSAANFKTFAASALRQKPIRMFFYSRVRIAFIFLQNIFGRNLS